MRHIINYAHCTKFTSGHLDRYPWSEYETRAVEVQIEENRFEEEPFEEQVEYIVIFERRAICTGTTLKDALALASYELMKTSRDKVAWSNQV